MSKVKSQSSTGGTSGINREAGRQARTGVGHLHSSVDLWDSITHGERREGTCLNATKRSKGVCGDGSAKAGIKTPGKVRKLQIALYRKAKEDHKWRAYSLYGEVCRKEVLETAMKRVIGNGGAAGVDGFEVAALKASAESKEKFLSELQEELRAKTYKPSPVRRVYIWKDAARTRQRALGIPTVKDRVVQTAVALLLMPIWEADFHEHSYAYRPGKQTKQAMDAVSAALLSGRTEVVDADLSSYFDTIPHAELIRLVARRVSDGSILKLIKAWLRAPIVEEDRHTGKRRILPNSKGTPQGGVISPLLANLYLNGLDHAVNERCEQKPRMVRYADDIMILCRPGQGREIKDRLKVWTEAKALKLNEEKTKLVDARKQGINFLGFNVTMRKSQRAKTYIHTEPNTQSRAKLREKVKQVLNVRTRNRPVQEVVKSVNALTRGWANAFEYGNCSAVFGQMQSYVRRKLRDWLWRRHGQKHGREYYGPEKLHQEYQLWSWPLGAAWKKA